MWLKLGKLVFSQSPLLALALLMGYSYYLAGRVDSLKLELKESKERIDYLQASSDELNATLNRAYEDFELKLNALSTLNAKKRAVSSKAAQTKLKVIKERDDENLSDGLSRSVSFVTDGLWGEKRD